MYSRYILFIRRCKNILQVEGLYVHMKLKLLHSQCRWLLKLNRSICVVHVLDERLKKHTRLGYVARKVQLVCVWDTGIDWCKVTRCGWLSFKLIINFQKPWFQHSLLLTVRKSHYIRSTPLCFSLWRVTVYLWFPLYLLWLLTVRVCWHVKYKRDPLSFVAGMSTVKSGRQPSYSPRTSWVYLKLAMRRLFCGEDSQRAYSIFTQHRHACECA